MQIEEQPNEKKDEPSQEEINASHEAGVPTDLETLKDALSQAEKTRDEFKDKYLRVAAEMDNMRRRFEREKTDLLQFGHERIMQGILPILDSFDKALPENNTAQGESGEAQGVLAGLVLVKKQLTDFLARQGLEAISAEGKPFDPNLHQAIQRVDSDTVETETVQTEFARGYLLNGRLIRPAMVSVLVPGGNEPGLDA